MHLHVCDCGEEIHGVVVQLCVPILQLWTNKDQ